MAHIISSRRRFLGGLAAGLMGTPFLPRFAGAGADPIPKRIVFVFTPNGTVKDNWLDWNAEAGQLTEHDIEQIPFGEILQPLESYRESMLVMRGINMESAYDNPVPKDHWPDYMNQLTGRQPTLVGDQEGKISGISIDQVIAAAWAKRDGSTLLPTMELGMRSGYSGNRVVSALGANQPMRPINDPLEAFRVAFEGLDLDPTEAAALRAKRGRVLDAVTAELHSAECQLVGEDRAKLDTHIAAIEQLEDSLDAEVGSCTVPELEDIDHQDDHNLRTIIEQQFLNLKSMFSCGITRVATVMMGDSNTTHHELGHAEQHHYYSHSHDGLSQTEAAQRLTEIDAWYAARIKDFLDQLRETPGADGTTLFDHTLVIWCHEQSTGAHLRRDMPYVFFGGSQSPIGMGRVIHAGGDYDHRQVTVNDLWVTVANRLGVNLSTFGDPLHFKSMLQFLE